MTVERKPVAFGDLRGWMSALKAAGELREIDAEVDWNIEMGTVMRLAQGPGTGPALLFNNIKDYGANSRCRRVFSGGLSSYRRIAMMMGLSPDTHPRDLVKLGRTVLQGAIPPRIVSDGPCKDNIVTGKDVNLYDLPVPWFNRLDGGRYILTYGGVVTKDPETGIQNVGIYRGLTFFTPNINIFRDPRWGRTEETYGEDPYLASRLGVAAIRAIQGPGPSVDGEHVIATAKHFAAHGQPEAGTNTAPVNVSERILRELFLPPFEAAVKEAGVLSVMPSYNEIDGVPSHANPWLLQRLLRQEWGFRGLIAADYNGISELASRHKVAADRADAARQALAAGVDMELPDPSCYPLLPQLVRDGKVSMAAIDQAVARILRAKFQLGLFENPLVDVERAVRVTNSPAHQQLAAEAARRSLILLKNEGGLLPLDRGRLQSLAVIGPNAARAHLGGYSDDPRRGIGVLDGIRAKVGDRIRVNYAEGCRITKEGGDWWADRSTLSDAATDEKLIAEAVAVAQASDAALLVIGGNEDTNKEAWADNHLGDRDSLDLVGRQNDLVRAVLATGKPTIVLLIHSSPLSINYIAEKVPAILDGFYLGQETGVAVADVLFGDANPGGKLAVSVPRSVGQLPIAYNHKPTARRGYLYTSAEPLFPFGFGLSYTTFAYSDLKLSAAQIGPQGDARVSVTVRNTGARAGDEIVQLYIRDVVSSVTRPVLELKDFARLSLAPGESRTVTFQITPDKLAFYDLNMNRVVEPGAFDIMVGPSSVKHQKVTLEVVGR